MSAKGLGKDFSALISDDMLSEALAVGVSEDSVQNIALKSLQPNPQQPRKHFEAESLNELAASIREHGIIQPLIVAKNGSKYIIIAGERRYRAAEIASLQTVPAIVRSFGEQQKLEVALIENIQRQDLTVLDLASAYLALHTQFNLSYEQISEKVGKSTSAINNIVRLLKLPLKAKEALHEGLISEGHARQIIALKDEEDQLTLLRLIIKNHWTVRQAEQYVVGHKQQHKDEQSQQALQRTKNETKETKQLAKYLDTSVRVRHMAKGGQILINFKDEKHLEDIAQKLLD